MVFSRKALVAVAFSFFSSLPLSSAGGASYNVKDTFIGSSFLSGFTHEAIADPTHGRVNYVNVNYAVAHNLTYASSNTFIMRADSTTKLAANGVGRNSVRIKSKATYTTHVAV